MFKTDEKSLERLSFAFDERAIANLSHLLDVLKTQDLSTVPPGELARLEEGLKAIGKLKLEGKIYAFHVEDEFAYRQGDDAGWGVELYRRQGNLLTDFCICPTRDWVLKPDQTLNSLRQCNIRTLYTGDIEYRGKFLDLPQNSDPEDPLERSILREDEIAEYASEGIEVVVLDKLI